MTFETKLQNLLVLDGLWGEHLDAVMRKIKDEVEDMDGTWDHDIDSQPYTFLARLWLRAIHIALKYIDENCPNAFYWSRFLRKYRDE